MRARTYHSTTRAEHIRRGYVMAHSRFQEMLKFINQFIPFAHHDVRGHCDVIDTLSARTGDRRLCRPLQFHRDWNVAHSRRCNLMSDGTINPLSIHKSQLVTLGRVLTAPKRDATASLLDRLCCEIGLSKISRGDGHIILETVRSPLRLLALDSHYAFSLDEIDATHRAR